MQKLLWNITLHTKTLDGILDFHYRFESVHTFQDANGRLGQLILFKECLCTFIIKDNLKLYYYCRLPKWPQAKDRLRDIYLTAQDRFKKSLDYFRINTEGKTMKEKISDLKKFNWRLWISLCALALIPAVYQTIKTFLISANEHPDAFDIIGQMEWFDLINETLQAFLIIPLYSVLNKIIKNDKDKYAEGVFKTGVISFALYVLFSIGVLIYGSVLISAMNPGEINIAATSNYLRLETVAFTIGIILSFVNVVFVVVGKDKNSISF